MSVEATVERRRLPGKSAPLLAANVVCVCGSMMFVFTPLLVDSLRHDHIAYSMAWIALISSSDLTGMFAGAIVALFTVHRFDRRVLALTGLGALCLADLGSILASNAPAGLYVARLVAGCGAGLAMGVAYAAFGRSDQPERSFALFGLLQTAVGSAVIVLVAPLITDSGPRALFGASLILGLIGLAVAGKIEPLAREEVRTVAVRNFEPRTMWALGPLIGVTYFLFGLTSIGVWANVETIGRSFGLTLEAAAHAISFSLLGSVVGCLLVLATGNHWGRLVPSAIVGIVYLVGLGLMLAPQTPLMFVASVTAFQFGTNMGSHAFGAISEADPRGRLSVTYLLSLKAGFAVGPLCASWLLASNGFSQLIWLGLILSAIVLVLVHVTTTSAAILIHRQSTVRSTLGAP